MENHIFAGYPAKSGSSLTNLCRHLLRDQKKNWPRLKEAYHLLSEVRTRSVNESMYQVVLNFNPQRAISSGAAVDTASIKNRPCFLCINNLPVEQKGILYRNEYLILCNPAPICAMHWTIIHKHHRPQLIAASWLQFLEMAYDLSPDFAVFYNGPACGASAPDHLHFQAIPKELLPLMKYPDDQLVPIKNTGGINYYRMKNIDRAVIILTGSNKDILQEQLNNLINVVGKITAATDEPMVNIICSYSAPVLQVMIFLRSRHRPDAYYREGEERIFVSPGAVDMAGVIITPHLTDFERLDYRMISEIYREVSLTEFTLDEIIDKLKGK